MASLPTVAVTDATSLHTVAVTGATGYLGSHVVKALLEAGYTVHAAVRNVTDETKVGPLRKLTESDANGKLLFFGGADLLQEGSFDQAFAGCDAVVHTAAIVEVLSQKDAETTVVAPSYGDIRCSGSAPSLHGWAAYVQGAWDTKRREQRAQGGVCQARGSHLICRRCSGTQPCQRAAAGQAILSE
jgi:NAD(P)-dependent dehydrogenase (short-subunit alcohol dehydrogenase family)